MTTTKQWDFLNRLTSISSAPSAASALSFAYLYNNASQRTRVTLADGSYWVYLYDSLGQVVSGKRYWSDGTPVAGQQFEYGFDDIGNRKTAGSGGDQNGGNLRTANYSANNLNQYSARDVPGYLNILGSANANATVTLWGNDGSFSETSRKGPYFRGELAVNNSANPLWLTITNLAVLNNGSNPDIVTNTTGSEFVAKTQEQFTYDAEGNLTQDGRWNYSWDAENRLVEVESFSSASTASKRRVIWEFDARGRRIRQTTYDGSSGTYVVTEDLKFVNDGWRCVAELNTANNATFRTYLLGLDLSGSMGGAGGGGGLLAMNSTANGAHFYAYDGNGNVAALVKGADGTISANYEYGPFGEEIRATGPLADENRFQYSTKRTDRTTDFNLYECRVRRPCLTWLSRDRAEEGGGVNLYCCVKNDPIDLLDALGMWATSVHHQIVEDWLSDPKYRDYPWRCCGINVVEMIEDGSDEVDGVGLAPNWLHWCEAQSSEGSYQHAMRDGATGQSAAAAAAQYNQFVTHNMLNAVAYADYARQNGRCYLEEWALIRLGRAYHSFSDSLSPAHGGFQPWWGPIDGVTQMGPGGYLAFVEGHEAKETDAIYASQKAAVVSAVDKKFRLFLDYILKN